MTRPQLYELLRRGDIDHEVDVRTGNVTIFEPVTFCFTDVRKENGYVTSLLTAIEGD